MIKRCKEIEDRVSGTDNAIGVIGDVAGAGKSYVCLSLVLDSRSEGTTVLVVPHNIYGQWERCIQTFAPTLDYKLFADYSAISSLFFSPAELEHDLLLVTSLYYQTMASTLNATAQTVNRVVFDEVDSIQQMLSVTLPCRMAWLVSASVTNLVGSDGDLKASAYTVSRARIEEATCKCCPAFVASAVQLEPPEEVTVVSQCSSHFEVLSTVVDDMVALHTYDYAKIAPHVVSAKEALELLTTGFVVEIAECEDVISRTDDPEINLSAWRSRLMTAEIKLEAVRARMSDCKVCPICYDDIGEHRAVTKCCANSFCTTCMEAWMKTHSSCPLCRGHLWTYVEVFSPSESEPESDTAPDTSPDKSPDTASEPESDTSPDTASEPESDTSTDTSPEPESDSAEAPAMYTGFGTTLENDKIENAFLIVTGRVAEDASRKFMLFSDNTHVFAEIHRRLEEAGLKCGSLDGGSAAAIDRDSQAFCAGDTNVLMVDSKLFGCGMNFEMATDVVFMHNTEPSMKQQVIGRAQRPGRTCRLNVWRLLHSNER